MVTTADRQVLMEIALSAEENAGYGRKKADGCFTVCECDIGEAMVEVCKEMDCDSEDYYSIYTFFELDESIPSPPNPEGVFYETTSLDLEELIGVLEEITSNMRDTLVELEMEHDLDAER